jgi:TolB protein
VIAGRRTVALALSLLLGVVAPGPAPRAQEATGEPPKQGQAPSDLNIRIVGAARPKIPIAVPAFDAPGSEPKSQDIARAIHDVVRDDLEFSGYFQIVPEEYHKLVGRFSDRRANYAEWLGIGAEALLDGSLKSEASSLVFEGRLFDTSEQRMVLGKRYRGDADVQRVIAHRLSNEIVQHYTGQTGIAMSRITFVSQTGRAKEISVMDYDGGRVKRVTGNGSINLSPAWSPDGKEIAFVSYRSGPPEMMILNSEGELHKAFPQEGELNSAPAWSPDGSLLAFASSRDGNAEIYTLRVSDGRLRNLTHNDAIDTSPTWSPSGREIAFTSDRAGTPQIYIMDAEGSNVRRLTHDVSYCDAASWSPGGDVIAFTGRVPGGFDIYTFDLKTGAQKAITQNANINEWPRWSPDGRHLVFASNRTGSFDVYTMDADGSQVRRLTHGGNSHSPSWSR